MMYQTKRLISASTQQPSLYPVATTPLRTFTHQAYSNAPKTLPSASKTTLPTVDPPSTKQAECQCPVPCGTSTEAQIAATPNEGPQQSLLQLGPLLVLCGAFVCSFISLQIKLFDHPLPPLQVTAVSSGLAWLATSCTLKATGMSPRGGCQASAPEKIFLLLLRGLMGAAAVCCYYAAIEELPLSVAVALFFFNPVFCVLFNAAITGRPLSLPAVGSCLLTVIGVLFIGWHDHITDLIKYFGVLLPAATTAAAAPAQAAAVELPVGGVLTGLAAAAANAAAFVTVNMIGPGASPLCLTWWQHLVVTHVTVGLLLFQNMDTLGFWLEISCIGSAFNSCSIMATAATAAEGLLLDLQDMAADVIDHLPSQHDSYLLLGVVLTNFIGQILLNAGFQRVDAGRGSAVNTSQVLFGCIWDVALLHSAPSIGVLLGSGAIAAGVYGTTLSEELDTQQQQQQQQLQPQQLKRWQKQQRTR